MLAIDPEHYPKGHQGSVLQIKKTAAVKTVAVFLFWLSVEELRKMRT